MQRRDFLKATGAGMACMLLPLQGYAVPAETLLSSMDVRLKKSLADTAMQAAREAGASYCDVRIGRYLRQFVATREDKVTGVVNTESSGVGIRVIAGGAWGFAATSDMTPDAVAAAARQATALAKANSGARIAQVQLAPTPGVGEVSWKAPIRKNSMLVPVKEKVELLLAVNAAAMKAGANFVNSSVFAINEQKYFASTDGSYIDQDIHRIAAPLSVTVIDKASGKFRSRDGLSAPMGMGYEYLDGNAADKTVLPSGVIVYGNSYDMLEDAVAAAKQAQMKLKAPSVKPGKYDLVLDPSHTWLTIHESVGHPTELDRVLGYEANYAGTSFVTLDKVKDRFQYGSPIVNITADKTETGSLGAVGYDDEGIKTQRWDIVRDGKLVDLQSIRDQAHMLGRDQSHGSCYADSWSSVQFQRMPNVSMVPGNNDDTWESMISKMDRGIAIVGDGSFSIDQQRYNGQFAGQVFYEVRGGKIVGQLKDVAYQFRTPEFWKSLKAVGGPRSYHLGGAFGDAKGQPGQSNSVSHGCVPSHFQQVNIINTGRRA